MSSPPKSQIPLRSPTPPLDSSSDELNELSLDQELAQLERPHFLDYTQIGIPYPASEQPPPIPPRHPLTNSLPLNRRSAIPVKMIRSADNVPSYSETNPSAGKKHFLDENPVPPDYDYNRPHRSLDRTYERKNKDESNIKLPFEGRRHSSDRQKTKKAKEPSYTLSRFLENDDGLNQYNDNEVQLSDVNLCASSADQIDKYPCVGVDVYSLLSVIGCNNPVDVSKKFLELSKSPNTCATLRRCIPLLVQMIHCRDDDLTRKHAREALRNAINYHPDDKTGRREAKVLRYIEQIMDYGDLLKNFSENVDGCQATFDSDGHPLQAMSSLMKISFDEEHRHSMCTLGALQTIANLVHYDHAVHGTNPNDPKCISFRRYAGMALTNLTFGDGNNKALLCANREFMKALVAQINTDADDLLQVTANVLRNLSWRADNNMKTVLNEIGTVTALTLAAMKNEDKENTLRAILSALWNLSAHCSKNKAEFCMVDGALAFIVKMLKYNSKSKTLSIVENAGGILRNVSSHIAVNEDYRKILRHGDCLGILLVQLKSSSLTIVSNACGTLWNLSARCPEDQKFLWDNGAVPMLRSLIHSKHKMISNGSKVALKNLVNFRPGEMNHTVMDPVAKMMGLKELPTLSARKQRALEDELDEIPSEPCDNHEPTKTPPPSGNSKAPKSLSGFEGARQQYIERNFEHLSLQCDGKQKNERPKTANNIWETTKPYHANNIPDFNAVPNAHPTGTIPKRTSQSDTDEASTSSKSKNSNAPKSDEPHKVEAIDSDQITNFSLVYPENDDSHNKAQKNRTFSVAEEDTIKCYDNEGTPLLSTATSISDLRPLPKHPIPQNMHRFMKIGRTTTENSGINTPEKPVNYCEEGTPAYFSRRDSFSSLHEEAEFIQDNIEPMNKPNQLNIIPPHKTNAIELRSHQSNAPSQPNDQLQNVDSSQQDDENIGSNNCTVPTTPGECASKTVTFNEFNLETPMMFSRHSSLGSLASNEPPLNDDIGSVVSETSRMPSGTISPSEIPDSPSQTMPQSPRQRHSISREHAPNRQRLPFDDEIRTFGVENTPALISGATSLSNLSLDDEPKIANDLLIKEMRLMHQLSDEQDDEPNIMASTSAEQNEKHSDSFKGDDERDDCDAGHDLSDSEESMNDDESLLNNCISIGMKAKNIEPDIKSPPALPEPNDILADDSASDDDLEDIIRIGITKKVAEPHSETASVKLDGDVPSQRIIKENPIGMLRKGGRSFIETNYDETNRFYIEDSPCNFSLASGLSDLTIESHTAGLLKMNRMPSIQSKENEEQVEHLNENRPLTPLSVNSEEERHLLQQAYAAGQARISSQKSSNTTSSQGSSVVTVQTVSDVKTKNTNIDNEQQAQNVDDDCHSSMSSMDSNDSIDLLEQCINVGMSKANQISQTQQQVVTKPILSTVNQAKKSQLPTPKASTSQSLSSQRSRTTRREQDDNQLLMDCINAGIERNIRSKSTVIEKRTPNSPPKRRESEQTKNLPSKNVQTTSATVCHTVGATDVVEDKQNGTVCDHVQHQAVVKSSQIMNSNSVVHDQSIHTIGDIIVTSVPAVQTSTDIGYNNTALNTSTLSTKSHNSFNMGCDMSLLERSNECPACFGQNEIISDSEHSSSVDMEISNECLFENLSSPKMDKHKDPNLMLQSVERLTHQLVSTAEYLRTTNSIDDDDITITDSKITFSTNTWNEDTNPNAISFPKMSQAAPVIESMHDDDTTISETNGLHFEIGGKVNQHNCNGDFDSHSTTTMSHSTIIAMEANKIRNQLLKDDRNDSIISLDKIQPPSVMDKLSSSSFCESLTSASSLNRSPARILTQKFIARRALQNNGNGNILGSNDSINLSLTLDRVKPPSIMDELLDSMTSVDSIASEYIDNPPPHLNEDPSHYETALSECDDLTVTLKNCADLPYDNTPCGSDFSSAESTPKKGRRSMTPRRKRQMNRDRYQTFTILNDNEVQPNLENQINSAETGHADGKDSFHLQVSNHPLLINGSDSDAISLVSSDGEMSSLRAFTKNLPHLNDISIHNDVSINTNTYVKQSSSKTVNSNRTPTKAPRIVKPDPNGTSTVAETTEIPYQPDNTPKPIRGQKKPAYVSPYSISNLTKSSRQPKIDVKTISPKNDTSKPSTSVSKTVESKAKSFIQRSAESLKKMRPTFTSKLSKQSSSKKPNDKNSLNQQKSNESAKSSTEKLVRQGTFTMDEPSEGIPVIVSEPTSPRKAKNIVSKIPFNRTTSLQATRNVTKCNTNIDIALPRNPSSTFIRRSMKSSSQTSLPTSRNSLSPRQSVDSPSTSKSIFNRWTPPNKKVSPLPASTAKLSGAKTSSRESIGSLTSPRCSGKVGVSYGTIITSQSKISKIGTCRTISTNGRTTKV